MPFALSSLAWIDASETSRPISSNSSPMPQVSSLTLIVAPSSDRSALTADACA